MPNYSSNAENLRFSLVRLEGGSTIDAKSEPYEIRKPTEVLSAAEIDSKTRQFFENVIDPTKAWQTDTSEPPPEQDFELPQVIEIRSLSRQEFEQLRVIVQRGRGDEVVSRLPVLSQDIGISIWGLNLLEYLIKQGYATEIFALIPRDLDLTRLTYEFAELLIFLMNRGEVMWLLHLLPEQLATTSDNKFYWVVLEEFVLHGKGTEIVRRLPKIAALEEKDVYLVLLLSQLLDHGLAHEVIRLLPEQFTVAQLTEDWGLLLLYLANEGYGKLVFDRLPFDIDLQHLNGQMATFFIRVIKTKSVSPQEVLAHLKKDIDPLQLHSEESMRLLLNIAKHGQLDAVIAHLITTFTSTEKSLEYTGSSYAFFNILISGGFAERLWNSFPETIKFPHISTQAAIALWQLLRYGYGDKIMERLPKELDLGIKSSKLTELIEALAASGYDQELWQRFPKSIDLARLTGEDVAILQLFASVYHIDVTERLPLQITINQLTENGGQLLTSLIEAGAASAVYARLTISESTIQTASSSGCMVVKELAKKGYGPEILELLPPQIEVETLGIPIIRILNTLIITGFDKQVLSRLVIPEDIVSLPSYAREFLVELFRRYPQELKASERLAQNQPLVRQAISPEELAPYFDKKVGPYLFETAAQIPLETNRAVPLKGGWFRAAINKSGSKTTAYFRVIDGLEIIFRNEHISAHSIKTYQKAAELLPGYVSSANYPELAGEPLSIVQLRGTGFREVFAGPSVQMIMSSKPPEWLVTAIERQEQYIKMCLDGLGIKHNHIHNENFNVRFLVQGAEGEKELYFDCNQAIQQAVQHHMTLTPIVTLRDWDSGSSIM